jgi:hypothetical protein
MQKKYTGSLLLSLLLIVLFSIHGCTIIDPAEKAATFVHIDSFQFDGGKSSDIKYAWVYYNNNPVGAFDLPATVPIITSGDGTVSIAPGIPINGRNEHPVAYPFYRIYKTPLAEQPGKITYLQPTTGYFDSIKTTEISRFEGGISLFANAGGTASIVAVSADSLTYEGSGSGALFLNSPSDSCVDSTKRRFTVPYGAAFIEFDYKSSVPFSLGLKPYLSNNFTVAIQPIGGVYEQAEWHKFYGNITSIVNQYQGGTYSLFIKANLPEGRTSGRLLIDNIKLVTF